MTKKKIYYIGYYDTFENSNQDRVYSLAAKTKMDYIINVLNRIGYKVLIISPSRTRKNKLFLGEKTKINSMTDLKTFTTFPWGNKMQKFVSLMMGDIMLFIYLLLFIKRNQKVLVYHSLELRKVVQFAKKIKRFELILEVEEIYQDVKKYSKSQMLNEYKAIYGADKYIFSTELLHKKINLKNKPFTIAYGAYNIEKNREFKFNDNKIHIVYAGTFDQNKGGASNAIKAAEYLTENFHLHIIGFGTKEEIQEVIKIIEITNSISRATVSYDGLLKGEDYMKFLNACNIGLSTQMPIGSYSESSFPSKILSYLANGLKVVTVKLKVIELSSISNNVYFVENTDPVSIAQTIMSIKPEDSNYDGKELIAKLDREFVRDLSELLER